MTVDNPPHPPADQIDAYVAAGLAGDELTAFEAHIRDCPACFAAVSQATAADAQLRNLFTSARPPAGLEDRLIRAVRQQPTRSLRIPAPVRKAAVAAAAVVLVSAVGYYGGQLVTRPGGTNILANGNFTSTGLLRILPWHDEGVGQGQAINSVVRDSRAAQSVFSATDAMTTTTSGLNHEQDGQNVLYSDGHVEFQNNPFTGTQRDNIYTSRLKGGSPTDTADSILLPDADGDGPADQAAAGIRKRVDAPFTHDYTAKGLPQSNLTPNGTTTSPGRILQAYSTTPPAYSDGPKLSLQGAVTSDTRSAIATTPPASSFKPTEFGLGKGGPQFGPSTLGGVNRYSGDTAVTGGTLLIAGGGDIAADGRANVEGTAKNSTGTTVAAPTITSTPVTGGKTDSDKKLADGATLLFGGQTLDGSDNRLGAGGEGNKDTRSIAHSAPATNSPTQPPPAPVETRKVIRNGVMEFEVDSFDSALATLTKLSAEAGGFVSTTDSNKLPNGKVKGEVILRIPPDRLDLFVLSLRALGDLKNQQITAQDVTKEYTDLESELTAARAMQARLMDLINSGKGTVKELLGVEQELGVWREKIEKAEGEIRYYNNLVGMSTLTVTLFERDIRTAASAVETETADVGIETEDVEKARTDALKAIDDVKGRVVESKLQRFDAGQLAAHITADVPPESAGTVIDRLKQLGKVARLEVNRQQTAAEGSDPAAAPLKVETKPTRLLVSLYNLANIAPRQSTNITLAANDVETAYAALVTTAKTGGGRIVNSNVNRDDPARANGSVVFEIPPDKLETTLAGIKSLGEVLKLAAVENPDTQNTTDAKHGLTVTLVSLASVQPRETVMQAIAAADVPAAYHAIVDAAGAAHGRVITAQLNEQDRQNVTGQIDVEVLRADLPAMDKALSAAGDTVARDVSRSADTQNTVDSKLLLRLNVVAADRLPPRETATLEVEVADVGRAVGDAQTVAIAAGGQVAEATVNKDRDGRETGKTAVEIPLAKLGEVLGQLKNAGTVRAIESARDPKAPSGPLAHAQIEITYETAGSLVTANTGLWATVRNGLATSVTGLLWSLQLLVIGLCLIGPWGAVIWVIWKLWKRRKPAGRLA